MDSVRSDEKFRSLYKATTPPWKETYRNRCLLRFRSARERLVDSFRCLPKEVASTSMDTDMDSGLVPQIIKEEWENLQGEKDYVEIDLIEEQDLIKTQILQELLEEEQKIVSQYQESIQFEEAAVEHCLLESDKILCPVCQKNWLRQNINVISCNCGLNLNTEYDAMTLDYMRGQLELCMTSHNSQCEYTLKFSQASTWGMTNLLSTCSVCDFMFIVI